MKLSIISMAMIFLSACGGKSDKKEIAVTDTASQSNMPVSNNTDTLVIDKNAAVYYIPDSARMEQWKKQVGEKDFETVADDWSFYMNESNEYLKTTNLPVHDASAKKVLKFVKADRSVTLVGLDTLSSFWGYYLFSTAKEPQFAEIVMMEDAYKKYFK